MTIKDVADRLETSASTVSRMETGRVSVRPRDLRELFTIYGLTDLDRQEELLELARSGRQRGWWSSYHDLLLPHYTTYIGLESEAASLLEFQGQKVPGLIQTPAYARSVLKVVHPEAPEESIERLVELRMQRQQVVEDGSVHHIVLDEAVLSRPVGGVRVFAEQLEHAADLSVRAQIQLQVLPFDLGGHGGLEGAFTVLQFRQDREPPVVYLDTLTGGTYVEREKDVRIYQDLFGRLSALALGPDDSRKLLLDRADAWRRREDDS